jgi:hypothetical protein
MSGWTIGWLSIAAAIGVLEALALVNRKRGDTLSEHVWILLGAFPKPVCTVCGGPMKDKIEVADGWRATIRPACPLHPDAPTFVPPQSRRLPPAWVRIRRFLFVSFVAWLVIHLATGWM